MCNFIVIRGINQQMLYEVHKTVREWLIWANEWLIGMTKLPISMCKRLFECKKREVVISSPFCCFFMYLSSTRLLSIKTLFITPVIMPQKHVFTYFLKLKFPVRVQCFYIVLCHQHMSTLATALSDFFHSAG